MDTKIIEPIDVVGRTGRMDPLDPAVNYSRNQVALSANFRPGFACVIQMDNLVFEFIIERSALSFVVHAINLLFRLILA